MLYLNLPITIFYASLLALFYVGLSLDVAYLRRKAKVALLGLGDEKHLNRAIRIHGNFSEYVPFTLLLLLLMEATLAPPKLLHGVGALLLVSRFLHAFGLKRSSGPSTARMTGITLTLGLLVFQAAWLLTRLY